MGANQEYHLKLFHSFTVDLQEMARMLLSSTGDESIVGMMQIKKCLNTTCIIRRLTEDACKNAEG